MCFVCLFTIMKENYNPLLPQIESESDIKTVLMAQFLLDLK